MEATFEEHVQEREQAEKDVRKWFALGSDSPSLKFEPLPHDDPRQRKPDITLAKKMLGWEPKVQLDEGLQHMIEYFKGIIDKI